MAGSSKEEFQEAAGAADFDQQEFAPTNARQLPIDVCRSWMLQRLGAGRWFQRVGHSHQLGERSGAHLPRQVSSVDLDGDLADSQLRCDLLVHEAGRYQCKHLLLARCQRFEAGAKDGERSVLFPLLPIPFEPRP